MPGYQNEVTIELRGEDQRILSRQIIPLPYINKYGYASLVMNLAFEIPGTAEAGRLVISTQDEYGRMTALNSVALILLALGKSDLLAPNDVRESLFIQQPAPKSVIQGGKLIVNGYALQTSDQFLMLQLIATDGRVVGKRVASLSVPPEGGYGNFITEVPYTVTEATPALLVVWEGEGGFKNVVQLSSVDVLLGP